jgi:hypothetical protein
MWYEMDVNYAQCQAVLDDIDDKDNFQPPQPHPTPTIEFVTDLYRPSSKLSKRKSHIFIYKKTKQQSHFISGTFPTKVLKNEAIIFVMSVCPHVKNWNPMDRFL